MFFALTTMRPELYVISHANQMPNVTHSVKGAPYNVVARALPLMRQNSQGNQYGNAGD